MHGRRFAGEATAKLFKDVVDSDEDLVKTSNVFFVVRLVVVVVGKGCFRRSLVRHCPDLGLYAELFEILEDAGIKVGNRKTIVECKILVSAVARLDLESVLVKVE